MFKFTANYKDFNGASRTEDLYFHMMAPEFVDLEFNPQVDGELSTYIRDALKSGDGRKIYTFFKLMIVNSYGRRSEDGASFRKKPEFTEEFVNSPAYETFFLWLTVDSPDGKNAEKFWNGIMPDRVKDLATEIEGMAEKKSLKDMTREELLELYEKRLSDRAAEV